MNATPQCYDYEVGSPGWSFFYSNEALPEPIHSALVDATKALDDATTMHNAIEQLRMLLSYVRTGSISKQLCVDSILATRVLSKAEVDKQHQHCNNPDHDHDEAKDDVPDLVE